jgi:hypothetical protein
MNTPLSRLIRLFALALVALLPGAVFAHPGHDLTSQGTVHMLTSPYHIMVLALGGSLLWWAGSQVQQRVPARVLSFSGAGMMVGAVVLWGLSL